MTADVLERFPKTRTALPPAYQQIYERLYQDNRQGRTAASSLAQRMEAWMHRMVAADVRGTTTASPTLEIGAGTLNHLPHEPGTRPYDIVEPFAALYEGSPHLPRIRSIYADVSTIAPGVAYERIVSVAAFEHICNLPEVVARSGLLLAPAGHLRVAIPSEGHFLWTLGWKLTTGLEFWLKRGLDYGVLIRHEHVNTAEEITAVLRLFFRSVRAQLFGLTRALSLYQFLDCSAPDAGRCQQYLTGRVGSDRRSPGGAQATHRPAREER